MMNKTLLQNLTYAGFLLLMLGIFSCSSDKSQESDSENAVAEKTDPNNLRLNAAQMESAGIKTGNLVEKSIGSEHTLNGRIEVNPQALSKLSVPGGGYVQSANFIVGDYVQQGQTLASIQNPNLIQMQEDYLLAKSNYSLAYQNAQRQKALNQSKATSDKNREIAETEARNQNIIVQSMAQKLRSYGINPSRISSGNIQKTTVLTAPISGYVSAVHVSKGEYVSETQVLFEIMNPSAVRLVLKAFEKDLPYIKVGQNLQCYSNQAPQEKYWARVQSIAKDVSPDRSVGVNCSFTRYNPQLIPGSYMIANIQSGSSTDWAIPEAGIVSWEGGQYVFVAKENNSFEMTPVKAGNTAEGFTQLLGCSDEFVQQKFVTAGAYNLLMALKNEEE